MAVFYFWSKKRGSDDKHHFPKFPYAPLKAIRRTHEYNNMFSNSFQSLVLLFNAWRKGFFVLKGGENLRVLTNCK